MSPMLEFTDNAARKVWELIEEEGNFALKLRVFVTGGGCSGFRYDFTFEEEIAEDDLQMNKSISVAGVEQQVCLLVDALSIQYLQGATIDYKEDISGEEFIIRNPNAKTTCGCGSSFSIED